MLYRKRTLKYDDEGKILNVKQKNSFVFLSAQESDFFLYNKRLFSQITITLNFIQKEFLKIINKRKNEFSHLIFTQKALLKPQTSEKIVYYFIDKQI